MTAVEILEWLKKYNHNDDDSDMLEVFNDNCVCGIISDFTPEEIVDKIEKYEAEKNKPESLCKHSCGEIRRNEIGEKVLFCEEYYCDRNITLGDCIGNCGMEEHAEPSKIKLIVSEKFIIIEGTKDNPYYGILYKEIGKDDYTIGFGSYNLDYVRKWFDEEFEHAEPPKEPTDEEIEEFFAEARSMAEPPKEKTKVSEKYIIIRGTEEKPCYEIMYKEIEETAYTIGFGSYNLDFVRKWFDEELEVVEEPPKEELEFEDFKDILKEKLGEEYSNIVLNSPEEFSKWVDRMKWHVKKCNELVRAMEGEPKEEKQKIEKLDLTQHSSFWLLQKINEIVDAVNELRGVRWK